MEKRFDGKKLVDIYSGKKDGKLGTKNNPVQLIVKTAARSKEVSEICKKNDWACEVKIKPNKDEDINDLELLQNPIETVVTAKTPGRNEPCSCGSGKKYKQCCGK